MSEAQKNPEDEKPEVMPVESSFSLIQRAEIDTQISTAKTFPRSLTTFKRKLLSMATIDPEVAQACTYALPRDGKTLQGPSVRFAEMIAASYGNLRTGARVIHNNGRVITAQGVVHDLEGNIFHTEEVERRITNKYGKVYSEDMQVVAGRAACAIAYRNAIFKVVPAALVQDVYEKVQEVARGDAETLPQRREKRLKYFRDLGVKDEQIALTLGVKDVGDIDLDKLVILQGMVSAHKNQETTLDDLFPPPDPKAQADKAVKAAEKKLDKKTDKKVDNPVADGTDKLAKDLAPE